jgi:S1-C subfamily serine protease
MAPSTTRSAVLGTAAAAIVAAALGFGGYDYVLARTAQTTTATVAPANPGIGSSDIGSGTWPGGAWGRGSGSQGSTGGTSGSSGSSGWGSSGSGSSGSSGTSGSSSTAIGQATSAQLVGVVDIVTTLDFGSGQAAGTGIVLTSNGRILTNNHVIEGSTSISVTVLSTGRSYSAEVVGTSPSNDVAVIQLSGASGLPTATIGQSADVEVGDPVVGVGNAGNAAGTSASSGTVTALDQSITASDQGGGNAEQLTGLIETDAPIQAGDSGGPLYAADGSVVGMDTAGQTNARTGATVAGYAIPIDHAMDVVSKIVAGVDDATIHQGRPAFLGVSQSASRTGGFSGGSSSSTSRSGVTISGVIEGTAAAKAGLAAGDTITSLGGQTVTSSAGLSAAITAHNPGDSVRVTWIDSSGATHSATVTLGAGPAD